MSNLLTISNDNKVVLSDDSNNNDKLNIICEDLNQLIEYHVSFSIFSRLVDCCNAFLINDDAISFAHKQLQEVVKEIKRDNCNFGKLYETLVYAWLSINQIKFVPQNKIESIDCFKMKDDGYDSDGKIYENNIVFDVKNFGISISLYPLLQKKLQSAIANKYPNYTITISGKADIDTKQLQKDYLQKIDEIISELFRSPLANESYVCGWNDLQFRADKNLTLLISQKSFNAYEWAENNKYYFLSHSSQFCINAPYIIFSVFDSSQTDMILFSDCKDSFQYLRIFCRRVFVELTKIQNRYINEFDGKAKKQISVASASKKISAIVFMDIKSDNISPQLYVYLNPNADNKLFKYQIDTMFRNQGAFIEDYEHDNY